MRQAILKNMVNGVEVKVHATTEHPASSYNRAVWVDDDNNAYCEVDTIATFYEITEIEENEIDNE